MGRRWLWLAAWLWAIIAACKEIRGARYDARVRARDARNAAVMAEETR